MAPSKLSDTDKQKITQLYCQPGETTSSLAEKFGVSSSTVSRVLKQQLSEDAYGKLVQWKRSGESGSLDISLSFAGDAIATPSDTPADGVPSSPSSAAEQPPASQASDPPATESDAPAEEPAEVESSDVAVSASEIADEPPDSEPPDSEADAAAGLPSKRRSRRRSRPQDTPEAEDEVDQLPLQLEPSSAESQAEPEPQPEDLSVAEDSDEVSDEVAAMDWDEKGLDDDDDYGDDEDYDDDLPEDEDELDDWQEDAAGSNTPLVPRQEQLEVLPFDTLVLKKPFYLVVDRLSELITCPLKDFSELGLIPEAEEQARTLPVFDNHRVARRFSRRNQRIVKIPDGMMLTKTQHYLHAKGITRILFEGNVYALN